MNDWGEGAEETGEEVRCHWFRRHKVVLCAFEIGPDAARLAALVFAIGLDAACSLRSQRLWRGYSLRHYLVSVRLAALA